MKKWASLLTINGLVPTYAVSNTFTYLILTQKPTPAMHQYSHYIHLPLLFNHLGGFPPKAASAEA